MFDLNKRLSLFKLGGLAAVPVVGHLPSATLANTKTIAPSQGLHTDSPIPGNNENFELRIELLLDDSPRMRVMNTSKKPVLLSQVRPGVVHAGKNAYDLNAAISGNPMTIEPGLTRTVPIKITDHLTKDGALDDNLKRLPLRVAMVTADSPQGRLVHSTRAFYS